ncbi:MAG: ATP-dependent helicase [Blastopirellula sp.]|nr:MAG: ATP-dependent helicase [Blastopirellula sp.]
MTIDLLFTPSGRITIQQTEGKPDSHSNKIIKAFESCPAEGLITLTTHPLNSSLAPSFAYWRAFAGRYLTLLCHNPEGTGDDLEKIPPPEAAELSTMLLNVPPMPGAEYISADSLKDIWQELDEWVHAKVAANKTGLSGFFQQWAPLWHQVGRVCFHLAENRGDPDYPFAFLATYSPSVSQSGRVQYQPLSKALQHYAGAKNKKTLIKLLSPVHLAAEASSLVQEMVESSDIYQPLAWSPKQAHQFLQDVPLLEESGILVRVPDWWKKRSRPMVGVTIGDTKKKNFDAKNLLDFKVHLALGDQQLSKAEWRELIAGEEGLVMLRGQWVEVDRDKLTEALEHWKLVESQMEDGVSFIDGMRLLAGAPMDLSESTQHESDDQQWSFVNAGNWLGQILTDLRSPQNLKQKKAGSELKATLREYQETGVNWLSFLSSLGLGGCLADDMGLGKTIQVLALLLMLKKQQKQSKPSLLVLPASLLGNWQSEIERFAPSLRTCFVHPSQTPKDQLAELAANPDKMLKNTDVVLTTYGMVLRQSWLLDVNWKLAVLDEAQAIKNPGARQTKAIKQLKAESRIALTGTPVENRLSDLWSLFDFICPGLLGSQQKFKKFVKSLENREDDRYAPLRRLVGPYILRRLKTDKRVISDLPEKTEVRAYCGLSKKQAALYTKMVAELKNALKGEGGIKRRGLVLAYLMRFKQLCNHPSQLLGDGDFTAKESGKVTRLIEICEEIASRQEKVLVFTQFREMTEPLSNYLATVFGRSGLILHGGTPVKRRKKLVEQFQQEDGPPFFVLSLKAGGTGLNLTAASHVIHFDRWWNPAVENQATDRAFRIGQKRNVLVHKFVCQGTIEEKIDSLITDKNELATNVLEAGSEKMLTEMTDTELIQLVSLDVERVNL